MTSTDFFADRATVTEAICPGCGAPSQCVIFGGRPFFDCDPCSEAEKARRIALDRKNTALAQWDALTPDEFKRPIIHERLHPAIAAALKEDGLSGCAMVGENDAGKTRVGYALLRRCAAAGKSVYAVRASAYASALAARDVFDKDKAAAARELMQRSLHASALLLDDVGKGEVSDKANAALYDLLTHRRDKGLITHWTANAGSQWLRERFGKDRGPAIVLRLARLAEGRIFVAKPKGEAP